MKVLILGYYNIVRRRILSVFKEKKIELFIASKSHKNQIQGGKRQFKSYEIAIKKCRPNLVYISLPNSKHFYWAKKSLNNKCNTIVDKPITVNRKQINELINSCFSSSDIFFPPCASNDKSLSFNLFSSSCFILSSSLLFENTDTQTGLYLECSFPTDLSAHDDTTSIPARFDAVIVDGATAFVYQYRGETQQYQLNMQRFEQGIKNMQTLLVNKFQYLRSTYIPRTSVYSSGRGDVRAM